ncbi:MAG: Gfo/Idh/MocA family oxidoreductase [Candidatus Marinimicrobia bacterium]|nr:Gfo/Idh/MocA family oxidoreductase [Candidatus Neomarinimicrobiota bacterium]
MKNFAIIGVGGYIAPRHLKAIKDTGNNLVAATDPFDSVGILDRYFFDVNYFKEFERFDRHIEKLRRMDQGQQIDYVSICSPNYLHDAHIRFALRVGADAICEKPLVLNPWNIDALAEIEEETHKKIYNILQLRVHPAIIALREKVLHAGKKEKYDVDLTYITSRGKWYFYSWKGYPEKSGGVATNIGIHFFDMLTWIFGDLQKVEVHVQNDRKAGGFLELENANVRWFLSLDKNDLPENAVESGNTTYRSILVEGEEIEFSGGFTDLHTVVYQDIINGKGFGIKDAYTSVKIAHDIRHALPKGVDPEKSHPLLLTQK